MIFNYIDFDGRERKIHLPIEEDEFNEIRNEVKKSNLEDLDYWEFWDLRDYLFNEIIIKSFEEKIVSFFKTLLSSQYLCDDKPKDIEIDIVDVYYHFYYGESIYLFSEPSAYFYKDGIVDRVEIDLEYETESLEYLLEKILDEFNVNYKTWKEDDCLSDSELELGEMFTELVFKCWSKVKKESGSKVFGMLSYATGGGGCFDLDSKEMLTESKECIKDYYEKRGMMILK